MSLEETPWNDAHHHSSFILSLGEISSCLYTFVSCAPTHPLQTPILVHEVLSWGNMGSITATIPINIFVKPGIVENIYVGVSCSPYENKIYTSLFKEFCNVFVWSYEEMSDIYPSIVMHEIPTYPNAKVVHHHLQPVHPRKVTTIKG